MKVICLNVQVTADVRDDSGMGMRPALGLAWADMVGMRLMMYRNESVSDLSSELQTASPQVSVQACNLTHIPCATILPLSYSYSIVLYLVGWRYRWLLTSPLHQSITTLTMMGFMEYHTP